MASSGKGGGDREHNKDIAAKYDIGPSVGKGTFGVILKATEKETGQVVAIKRVFQDRRYKNRELEIMKEVKHPNVVEMLDVFFTKGKGNDVYLNLVMEFIPDTIFNCIQLQERASKKLGLMYTRLYCYQLTRSLAYIHRKGICHRDIKPQNVLVDPATHRVKLCDFGSAKKLRNETSIAYICSRYYRAPELIFEATKYTTQIDVWSLGCVMAEFFLGRPIFRGSSSIDQLVEIVKVLGAPTKEDIKAMNPNHSKKKKYPSRSAIGMERLFQHVRFPDGSRMDPQALDLMANVLMYQPLKRLRCFEALAHPFFQDLRRHETLPDGKPMPPVFNWTDGEVADAKALGMWGEDKSFKPSDL